MPLLTDPMIIVSDNVDDDAQLEDFPYMAIDGSAETSGVDVNYYWS